MSVVFGVLLLFSLLKFRWQHTLEFLLDPHYTQHTIISNKNRPFHSTEVYNSDWIKEMFFYVLMPRSTHIHDCCRSNKSVPSFLAFCLMLSHILCICIFQPISTYNTEYTDTHIIWCTTIRFSTLTRFLFLLHIYMNSTFNRESYNKSKRTTVLWCSGIPVAQIYGNRVCLKLCVKQYIGIK